MTTQREQQEAVDRLKSSTSTRDMTTLDDLTHDFDDNQAFRESCLAKYGQYFSHNGKRVVKR